LRNHWAGNIKDLKWHYIQRFNINLFPAFQCEKSFIKLKFKFYWALPIWISCSDSVFSPNFWVNDFFLIVFVWL
jgi:hypothetical protein